MPSRRWADVHAISDPAFTPTYGNLQAALRPPHSTFSRLHVAGEIRKVNVSIFDVQQKPTTALRIHNNIRRGEVGCRAAQGIRFQALTAVKPYKVDTYGLHTARAHNLGAQRADAGRRCLCDRRTVRSAGGDPGGGVPAGGVQVLAERCAAVPPPVSERWRTVLNVCMYLRINGDSRDELERMVRFQRICYHNSVLVCSLMIP